MLSTRTRITIQTCFSEMERCWWGPADGKCVLLLSSRAAMYQQVRKYQKVIQLDINVCVFAWNLLSVVTGNTFIVQHQLRWRQIGGNAVVSTEITTIFWWFLGVDYLPTRYVFCLRIMRLGLVMKRKWGMARSLWLENWTLYIGCGVL